MERSTVLRIYSPTRCTRCTRNSRYYFPVIERAVNKPMGNTVQACVSTLCTEFIYIVHWSGRLRFRVRSAIWVQTTGARGHSRGFPVPYWWHWCSPVASADSPRLAGFGKCYSLGGKTARCIKSRPPAICLVKLYLDWNSECTAAYKQTEVPTYSLSECSAEPWGLK